MPVSEPTILLEFQGSIAGAGRWACGLWTTVDVMPADPNTGIATVAAGAAAAFRTLWTSALGAMNTIDTAFTGCSARLYAPNATASSAVALAPPSDLTPGTGPDSAAASQACVVTLQSPQAGRSGRGRMYMPATANLGTGAAAHQFPIGEINNLVAACIAFFIAVEALTPDSSHALFPVVRSQKMGTVHPFKQFRIDARPDRQEHRERGLVYPVRSSSFA